MTTFQITGRCDVLPRQAGRYLSFPGMAQVVPGRLLLGYRDAVAAPGTYSHGHDGDLKLIRCADGKWSAPELLYRHQDNGIEEMGCGDLSCLRDGTVTLWSRQWDGANHRTHDVYLALSTDCGTHFSPRRAVRLRRVSGELGALRKTHRTARWTLAAGRIWTAIGGRAFLGGMSGVR